jgi:hypothetical protein
MSQITALPGHGAERASDYVSAARMAPVRVAGGGIQPPYGGFGFEKIESYLIVSQADGFEKQNSPFINRQKVPF